MEIVVAKNAGFCFGVSKAVNLLFELVENSNGKIYTLGPIIHNDQVVEKLAKEGVAVVNDINEITQKGKLVIRTHGITSQIYEDIINRGIDFSDATCPYVKKIHTLVNEKHQEGYQIVIVGDKNHPEVIGINGWCSNTSYIVNSKEDVDSMDSSLDKLCVVAQTTITKEKWDTINKYLNNKFKNVLKFDTICSATNNRQNEAAEVAKNVDIMLVIGSKNSSNTQKLYDICSKYCSKTIKIETSGDIPPMDIKNIKNIGITAGASTPDWVIKEVIGKMEELNKMSSELSFKEAFESSLVTLNSGEVVKGKIIGFNNSEVYVDLGYKSDGIIKIEEFTDDVDFKPSESIKVGEEIEVYIVRVNDREGIVELSKKKVDSMKGWDKLVEAFENKTPVKVKVIEIVNGGVISSVSGIKIFIPASQISDRYVKELNGFLKQVFNIRIIDYNKQKRKFVGSQRVILEEEREKAGSEFWGNIEIGKKYQGTVKNLMDFGAFVDIGGVDGLIHMSELSWNRIKHPSAVMKVGDKVEVTVLEFDKDKKKVSLGYKKHEDNPWVKAANNFNVGDIVKGKVVRIVPFGAFVELDQGVDGLVHISQISNDRIAKPSDVLEIGQMIEAKITDLNTETKKISLSIKEVNPIPGPNSKDKEEAIEAGSEAAVEETPSEHKEEIQNTIGDLIGNLNTDDVKE